MLIDQIFFDNSFIGKGWYGSEIANTPIGKKVYYRWMPSGKAASVEVNIPANTNVVIRCFLLSVLDKRIFSALKVKVGGESCYFRFEQNPPDQLGSLLEVFVPMSQQARGAVTFFVPFSVYPSNQDKRAIAMAFYDIKLVEATVENLIKFIAE